MGALHVESLDRGGVGDHHHRPLEAEEFDAEVVAKLLPALLHERKRSESPAQRLDQGRTGRFGWQHQGEESQTRLARGAWRGGGGPRRPGPGPPSPPPPPTPPAREATPRNNSDPWGS